MIMSSAAKECCGNGPLPLPLALQSRNPLAWLTIFGPGAVIASLTIGSGELIFSSRGGELFGYRLLWFFLLVLLLKWALVFVTARHMVLSGAHPFQRWMELPGPRGWFSTGLLSPGAGLLSDLGGLPFGHRWHALVVACWNGESAARRRPLCLGHG